MSKRFLEDIVKEDVKREGGLGSKFASFFDTPIIKNPFPVAVLTWYGSEYVRSISHKMVGSPFASFLAAYGVYSFTGLVKDYLVNRKSTKFRGVYQWFLDNPRIFGLFGAIGLGIASYYGEKSMGDVNPKKLVDVAISHGIQGGILVEVLSRGLKNLRRIKSNIEKFKTSTLERYYNWFMEHPVALSGLSFLYYAGNFYSSRTRYRVHHPGSQFLSGSFLDDVVNHLGALVSVGARAGVATAATIGVGLVASSLLHSHTIRDFYYRSASLANELLGRKHKVLEYQEKIVALPHSVEKSIEDVVNLGNIYYQHGNRNEAFRCYRRALRLFSKKSGDISYADFFRKALGINTFSKVINKFRLRKLEDEKSAINRIFIGLLNKDNSCADYAKDLVDRSPEDPKLIYMYGKVLEVLGYQQSAREQKKKAVRKILETGIGVEEIGNSKNKVVLFDDELLKGEIIAKAGLVPDLLGELETTERAREVVDEFEDYEVPVPIGVMQIGNKDYYIMERASGDLLADKIRDGNSDVKDFLKVADFMGLLHAKLEPRQVRRDVRKTIKDRLDIAEVHPALVDVVCYNLEPLIGSLENIAEVYNKDGHPSNWIVNDYGGICCLDLEAGRVVPLTFDTANLLNQHTALSEEERDQVVLQHLISFEKYSEEPKKIDREEYKLAYLNSLIIRGFELYGQVKDNKRRVMFASLNNARKAIDRVEREFPEYYRSRGSAYEQLKYSIEFLKVV